MLVFGSPAEETEGGAPQRKVIVAEGSSQTEGSSLSEAKEEPSSESTIKGAWLPYRNGNGSGETNPLPSSDPKSVEALVVHDLDPQSVRLPLIVEILSKKALHLLNLSMPLSVISNN
ncbi:hypothetical protein TIFTF001_024566 [Ficus carica]|uniref:Uncharacterized protein n=1 Tax=Ficus carica TaxID=3494 RepID=A0AA88DDE3_FICCA|nr:hypothetical protein TIFTF001_024566 [Ficus carica]